MLVLLKVMLVTYPALGDCKAVCHLCGTFTDEVAVYALFPLIDNLTFHRVCVGY